jgi:hypothetical protein
MKKEMPVSSDNNQLSGASFQAMIQSYAAQQGWPLADINDHRAILQFKMPSGRAQTLYILKYENTLEFSVPSAAGFPSQDSIPHMLSTLLLQKNTKNRFGFWCIEEIGGKQVYSYMHNAELQLLTAEYFGRVVAVLVNECDAFEATLMKMMP